MLVQIFGQGIKVLDSIDHDVRIDTPRNNLTLIELDLIFSQKVIIQSHQLLLALEFKNSQATTLLNFSAIYNYIPLC